MKKKEGIDTERPRGCKVPLRSLADDGALLVLGRRNVKSFPVDVRTATEAPAASTASFQCVDSVVHPKAHSPTHSRVRPRGILALSVVMLSLPPIRTVHRCLSVTLRSFSFFSLCPSLSPRSSLCLPHGHFSVVVAIRRASAGCAREGAFAS